MPKFKSIPHEVMAVQWKGEITPDLRALFGPRPIAVNTDPLGLLRPTLVVPQEGDQLAAVGDWVVRTDYDGELGFDLDVMEPDDFSETYEPAEHQPALEISITIPALLTSASGEAGTDIRIRINAGVQPSENTIAEIVAQLLPHLKDHRLVSGVVQSLAINADPETLLAITTALMKITGARVSQHH